MKKINKLLKGKKPSSTKGDSTAGFILCPDRLSLFFENFSASLAIQENLENTFKNLLEKCLVACGSKPKEAVVALNGFYSQSALSIVRFNRPDPSAKITAKEYQKIEERLALIAQNETEAEVGKAFGNAAGRLNLINSQVTRVKVDDFLVSSAIDHKGQAVELSFSNSFADEEITKRVEKIAKKEGFNVLTVTDFARAILSFAPPEINQIKDFILLTEAGKACQCAVIFNSQIITTRTLPLSFKLLEQKPAWFVAGLEETLKSFEGVKTFPSVFAVYPKNDALENLILEYDWSKALPFQDRPKVANFEISQALLFTNIRKALD
ncbi:MAG: hypothetical protein ABH814_01250 [bacterium]